jgi:hypothetical protein
MPPPVAVVRTSPQTVLADYERLLGLAALDLADQPALVISTPGVARLALPGERPEPWQLDGALHALCRAGYAPLVGYEQARDADPLAAVARRHGASLAPRGTVAAPTLLLGSVAPHGYLARLALTPQAPRAAIIDVTTLCLRRPFATPVLEIRNLLLASADLDALDALLAHLAGLAPLHAAPAFEEARGLSRDYAHIGSIQLVGDAEPLGDSGGITRLLAPAPLRAAWGLWRRIGGVPEAERIIYEDWVYNTGWGRLFRAYQRRAHVEAG